MRNLDHVAAFVAIADARGLGPASRRLGLSPQALQKAMDNMEADLGLKLFVRTRRAFALTEAGAVHAEGCRRVLAAAEEAVAALAGHRDAQVGVLRVAMPGALGRLHIMPALGGFLDRHPGVKVETLLADPPLGPSRLGVDAVFRVAPPAESPRVARRAMAFRALAAPSTIRICAHPAYLARRGTPRSPADLATGGHECVCLTSRATGKPSPWRFRAADGRPEERAATGRLIVADADAALAAAVAGVGLIQLPDYITGRALASGDLVEILPEHSHDGPPVEIGYAEEPEPPAEIRAFVDYFVEWFTEGTAAAR